jgi:hypothetical protein
MKITVQRTYLPLATLGEGTVFNENFEIVFQFKTLELPWKDNQRRISCYPEGDYMVWKMLPTKKRNYEYFWVQDVPGRDSILWHPGNYTRQILGCTLPGESFIDLDKDGIMDITNTAATLKILTTLMPQKFQLTVSKKEFQVKDLPEK